MKVKPSRIKTSVHRPFRSMLFFGLGTVIGVLVLAGWLYLRRQKTVANIPIDAVTITETASGFEPKQVRLKKGGTVTFVTKVNKPFWPASNPHPYHNTYAAFDSKKPIDPQESWSFTFDEIGIWQYHDHIRPFNLGRITVVDPATNAEPFDCTKPEMLVGNQREQCWDLLLSDALDTRGIKGAFAEFTRLYQTDKVFAGSGCHLQAHRIGEVVYNQYAKTRDFRKIDWTPESIACGYGFYHGFIEHMLRDDPDVNLAKEFCDYLSTKSTEMPVIRKNCYHSIGHGFMPDPPPQDQWGNDVAIVTHPLEVCSQVTQDSIERRECEQGVFNVLANWYTREIYGLKVDPVRPFKVCEQMTTYAYKHACYYEMSMIISPFGNNDLVTIADKYTKTIKEDELAGMVMNSVAAGIMQQAIVKDDHTYLLRDCYKLESRLSSECLKGISGGFAAHGEPGMEYVKGLKFCASPELKPENKTDCYQNMLRTFRGIYDTAKMNQVCALVPVAYQTYCEEPR